jgi:hypothetical protein
MEPSSDAQKADQSQEGRAFTGHSKWSPQVSFMVYSALFVYGEMLALTVYAMIFRDRELLLQVCEPFKFAVPVLVVWGSGNGVLEVLRKRRFGKRGTGPEGNEGAL